MNQKEHYVCEEEKNMRLDVLCAQICPNLSRQYLKELIVDGDILVDFANKKPAYRLKADERIVIKIPDPVPCQVMPESIDLDIVYEDGDVIVVNKPSGMVVHPASGTQSGTLVNALMAHTKDLSGINGVNRPGIVHRIDKDTSGILVVAKNDLAHRHLARQLAEHSMVRQYVALVKGNIAENSGTVDMPVGRHPVDRVRMAVVENGKSAVTHFEVIERLGDFTYVAFWLETGRTHQIRVHMQAIGHPIAGDPVYGGDKHLPFKTDGQLLHARELGFIHPRTKAFMRFEAPLPEIFQKVLNQLKRSLKR